MNIPIHRYLEVLRTQLATTLLPRTDERSRRVAVNLHRVLTVLLAKNRDLPALHQAALKLLAALLDELIAEFKTIEGSMMLIPQLVRYVRIEPDYSLAEPFLQNAVRLLSSSSTATSRKLLAAIAEITFEVHDGLHRAVASQCLQPEIAAAVTEALDDEQKLAFQAYLRDKFPAEPRLTIGTATALAGGGSKQTVAVELRDVTQLPATVVLRMDKPDGLVDSNAADEFQIIQAVHAAGVPVPQPLAVEADARVLGASFIVVSRIDGRNIGDSNEVFEPSRAFALGLARALAKLHQIPQERLGDVIAGGKVSTPERLRRELDVMEETWRAFDSPSITFEQACNWLRNHLEYADGPRSIIHCDVGCHNMLCKDGELTALLDWETAAVGNAAQDLAYSHPTVTQIMPWEEYLDEYRNAGGRLPSEAELVFYRVWSWLFRVYYRTMACSFFSSGLSSSALLAYATQYMHEVGTHRLAEAVKLAYEFHLEMSHEASDRIAAQR